MNIKAFFRIFPELSFYAMSASFIPPGHQYG